MRVVVGEITRGQQLNLFKMMRTDNSELTEEEQFAHAQELNATVAIYATRKVQVCQGGEWVDVNKASEFDLGFDIVKLVKPTTSADFDTLPRTLAGGWVEAALAENGGLVSLMSFTSASPTSSETGSEPALDSDLSDETPTEQP